MIDIAADIERRVPEQLLSLVRTAGELAADHGLALYLVGGTVRDLLLGRSNLDVDLVLEGDAPSLARRVARRTGSKVTTHPHFGTASVRQGDATLDVVTARSETYARPGALPTVRPGTIHDDLLRRDFTVNAMAASLVPHSFGELIDFHRGKDDLDRGLIRVLHEGSFRDDPTRIWRAIRYEQRLGFTIDAETETLLRRDLAHMDQLSGDRVRHEIERILAEDRPEKTLRRASELGVLQYLSPSLSADECLVQRFERARSATPQLCPTTTACLALLAWRLDGDAIGALIERLSLGRDLTRVLRDIPGLREDLPALSDHEMLPSQICSILDPHRPEAIAAASVATD
ncbi:MAG: CCA tRNA nucleotidyltransferase, partial [Planctomycetota bacterium]